MRARVHTDESDRPAHESGLFLKLPGEGLLDSLPKLDEPAGECPETTKRWATASNEEHFTRPNPDSVRRERRILVARGHLPGETPVLLGVVADEKGTATPPPARKGNRSVWSGGKH